MSIGVCQSTPEENLCRTSGTICVYQGIASLIDLRTFIGSAKVAILGSAACRRCSIGGTDTHRVMTTHLREMLNFESGPCSNESQWQFFCSTS